MSVYPIKPAVPPLVIEQQPAPPPAYDVGTFSLAALADVSAAAAAATATPIGEAVSMKRLRRDRKRMAERCWGCENEFGNKVDPTRNEVLAGLLDVRCVHLPLTVH